MKKCFSRLFLFISLFLFSYGVFAQSSPVQNGADQIEDLLPALRGKKIALVVNQTSCLRDGIHLLDELVSKKVTVTKIFAPEHGFRGNADAGESIADGKDTQTGTPIVSLYGNNKKPSREALADVDIVVLDMQDVGARFYTYISTMHYVMEACAESGKDLIVLDRPNPNDFVDGPVLEAKHKSFVGMHPIPVLHGLTIGELAQMINGEGWLSGGKKCSLKVVPVKGWKHGQPYSLPVKPSPNLPNDQAIRLYPSLCFFEATAVSVGRGTYFPFQVLGFPDSRFGNFTFTPKALEGFDKNPLQKDKLCYGLDLREVKTEGGLTLCYLLDFYTKSGQKAAFFKSPSFMDKLAGTSKLREQIVAGMNETQIRETWKADLEKYKTKRSKYLIYPDKD